MDLVKDKVGEDPYGIIVEYSNRLYLYYKVTHDAWPSELYALTMYEGLCHEVYELLIYLYNIRSECITIILGVIGININLPPVNNYDYVDKNKEYISSNTEHCSIYIDDIDEDYKEYVSIYHIKSNKIIKLNYFIACPSPYEYHPHVMDFYMDNLESRTLNYVYRAADDNEEFQFATLIPNNKRAIMRGTEYIVIDYDCDIEFF